MIAIGTRAHGVTMRRQLPKMAEHFYKSEWLEAGEDPVLSPTASLIEQPPHATLAAPFHRQNQFQVFVEGDGQIGPHALDCVLVHYAGAFTSLRVPAGTPKAVYPLEHLNSPCFLPSSWSTNPITPLRASVSGLNTRPIWPLWQTTSHLQVRSHTTMA